MIKLANGIYTWGRWSVEKKLNFNGFAIHGAEGTIVVDPPPFNDDDKAYWDAAGLKADLIVITNRNHLRGHAGFPGAPICMHEAEVNQVDIPVDRVVKDGQKLLNGVTVIHLPGKSPGEIGLHFGDIVLLGDALIAPGGALKFVPPEKQDDPALLKKSVRKLLDLDFNILLLADGDPLIGNAKARVAAFLGK